MRRFALVTLATTLTLLACGGGGKDSPRAVAEAVAERLSQADMGAVVALMPPDGELAGAIDCAGGERDLVEQLGQAKAKYIERGIRKADKMKGTTYALKDFDLEGTREKVVAAGEPFEGCVATEEIAVHTSRLTLAVTKGGETTEDGETWMFIRLGGAWYLAKL